MWDKWFQPFLYQLLFLLSPRKNLSHYFSNLGGPTGGHSEGCRGMLGIPFLFLDLNI